MKPAIPGILLGFKLQFKPMVKDGSKRHSLRGLRKIPRVAGGICHNYTGLRTRHCELLGRWPCTRIERVEVFIDKERGFSVAIEERILRWDELIGFAYADGFRFGGRGSKGQGDVLAMKHFWIVENNLDQARPWRGELIHWNFNKPVTKEGLPL